MALLVSIIVAYLIGSVNSAIIVCKMMGLPSPYTMGSGNPGATNVKRLGGNKPAVITLVSDILKGVIPVMIGRMMHLSLHQLGWVALACVIGHIYPLFFKFKGGKGVATAIGAITTLAPWLGTLYIATWLIIAKVFRISSLSAIIATLLLPVYSWFIIGREAFLPVIIIAVIVIIRHHANIKRLFQGKEKVITAK